MDNDIDTTQADDTATSADCLRCLTSVAPGTHFCPHCGAPLTMYATTAPLEQIWAFGDLINRLLADRSPSAIALVGTWLISLPMLMAMAMALASAVRMPLGELLTFGLIAQLGVLLVGVCHLLLVVRVTLAYARRDDGDAPTSGDAA